MIHKLSTLLIFGTSSIVFAGGNVNQTQDNINSYINGSFKASYGSIDFSRSDNDSITTSESADYLPFEFEAWTTSHLSNNKEAMFRIKYSKYNPLRYHSSGSTNPDDTPNLSFSAEALLLKDYGKSTSFTGLNYIRNRLYGKTQEGPSNDGYHTTFHGSLGGVYSINNSNHSLLSIGIASNSSNNNMMHSDEIIYLHLSHHMVFNDKFSANISHTDYQFESKDAGSIDEDNKDYQHTEIGFNYMLNKNVLSLEFGRIDVTDGNDSEVDKADTYMLSYSIPFGQKVSKRTKVIANSRPDIEYMIGFTSGPME